MSISLISILAVGATVVLAVTVALAVAAGLVAIQAIWHVADSDSDKSPGRYR